MKGKEDQNGGSRIYMYILQIQKNVKGYEITDTWSSFVKTRLFCKNLKRDTLRIVLVLILVAKKIKFIEIYFKEKEDKVRVRAYSK